MKISPPKKIEEMRTLYFADVEKYAAHLKKYMAYVPDKFVIVQDTDGSYCILGTDKNFENWDNYSNYIFKELQPAKELPHTIFRIENFQWEKV